MRIKINALAGILVIAVLAGAGWYAQRTRAAAPGKSTPVRADGSTMLMKEDGFFPETLTVPAGTTVKFVNADKYWHWPASDPHPSHTFYSELDPRQPIKPGDTWAITLTKPGKWTIHDHLAPYVTGTVVVTEK